MTNDKMTAVYCRVASKDDLCIEMQKKQVLQYAKEQGYGNIAVYVDNGANGLNFNRPAFMKMCDDIEASKIDTVVVKNICRIGRNIFDVWQWIDKLKRKGVPVKAWDGSCDKTDPPELEAFRQALAEYYKKQRKAKRAAKTLFASNAGGE